MRVPAASISLSAFGLVGSELWPAVLIDVEVVSLCLPSEFSSFQLLSHVCLLATTRTAARQASLSITNS